MIWEAGRLTKTVNSLLLIHFLKCCNDCTEPNLGAGSSAQVSHTGGTIWSIWAINRFLISGEMNQEPEPDTETRYSNLRHRCYNQHHSHWAKCSRPVEQFKKPALRSAHLIPLGTILFLWASVPCSMCCPQPSPANAMCLAWSLEEHSAMVCSCLSSGSASLSTFQIK